MNKLKLIRMSVVIVLAMFFAAPLLQAKVIIEGPDGSFTSFPDTECCEDWGDTPDGWECYDNC
jgi:hypothetical protein